ncbi:MAG TPA: PQQ-dependent sugar dehydrogenase [Acidimicrobiales bacterium]|jgi:aldose sugar dehydrogenase|nr:PQQ-dependent sugar dehydrogenase [Acidimicrobiales bacterium]HMS87991.1 PQQ-dependent sugar dehydrogenase [Acidimicrobiales bacterium]HRA33666.1 PQQ-dependent sugar dehydrogenase [Acidimicrobiales bacterium]
MRTASRIRRTLAVATVAVLASLGLSACPGPATLTVTDHVTGLTRPWDLAFLPDGGLLFTQRTGQIRLRTTGGSVVTLATPADVVAVGEGGMLGVAVDPAFATNRRIYTCFNSNLSGAVDVRLVRWEVNAGATALTDRTELVTGIPAAANGRHSGCRPRFGPDGHIWMGTGDSASPTVPQDPASLGGKVLRVTTSGAAAPGNPGGALDPRIYTFGHRNVQGVSFDDAGQAWSVEHGTDRDDELNKLVAGGNYGWDPRPLSGPLFYDESRPMTDPARHPGAIAAVWSSGLPTIAPSGATFIPVGAHGWTGWQDDLAMAVLKDQHLRILTLNSTRTAIEEQLVRVTGYGRLRSAVMGPDGNLYIATDSNTGRILKVTPSG